MATVAYYSPQALTRIRELGIGELKKFLREIPTSADNVLIPHLPLPAGFRKNSGAGAQRSKDIVAEIICTAEGRAPKRTQADNALYIMWKCWAKERMNVEGIISKHLSSFKIPESKNSDLTAFADQFQTAGAALFLELQQLSLTNQATKESIRRLFSFSPFAETEEIRAALATSKLAAVVEKERGLDALPARLAEDESKLVQLSADVEALKRETAQIGSQFSQTKDEMHAEVQREVKRVHKELNAALAEQIDSQFAAFTTLEVEIAELKALVEVTRSASAVFPHQNTPRTTDTDTNPGVSKFMLSSPIHAAESVAEFRKILDRPRGNIDQYIFKAATAGLMASGLIFVAGMAADELAEAVSSHTGHFMTVRASASTLTMSVDDFLNLVVSPISPELQGNGTIGDFLEYASLIKKPATVIIDGANRAPLESFWPELRRQLSRSARSPSLGWRDLAGNVRYQKLEPQILMIGILRSGGATFKISDGICRSIPVFNADAQVFPNFEPSESDVAPMALSVEAWEDFLTMKSRLVVRAADKLRKQMRVMTSDTELVRYIELFSLLFGEQLSPQFALIPLAASHYEDSAFLNTLNLAMNLGDNASVADLAARMQSDQIAELFENARFKS